MKRLVGCSLLLVTMVLFTGCPPPPPDPLVHYICFGEGSPTILLDSGFAMDWSNWRSVMQEVASQTRICAYDRPGIGESYRAAGSTPRTSLDMTSDIHNLLTIAGLFGPYIMVGHSAGGFNVLVYANRYPQDVVGMVLVDPCNPEIFQRMLEILPPEKASEPSEVADCRHILSDALVFLKNPYNKEKWDFVTSFEQVRAISSLADLPLIVITDLHDTMCQGELGDKEDQIWKNLHAEYAALSTNGSQVITNSGHILSVQNPQIVVEAILKVLEQVRSN